MPKTNWEFVQGQNSAKRARNPFPEGSGQACSWELGRQTPKRQLPSAADGERHLLEHGLQAHNAREMALGLLDQL